MTSCLRVRVLTAFGLLLFAFLTLVGALVPPAPALSAPSAQANGKLALAFYYTWFGPADFSHDRMPDIPLAAYDSTQPQIIERHVREASGAGIDGFIASWSGLDTPSDANLSVLLDTAVRYNFKVSVYFETPTIMQRGDVAGQLQGLVSRYAGHPAFLNRNGKPVIFFWAPAAFGAPAQWQALRAQVDPANAQLWSVDTTDAAYLDAFDTIHLFSAGKWQADTDAGAVQALWRATINDYNSSHGTQKLWVGGVIPGWDESRIQPPRANAKVLGRGDGALYNEMWRGAVASNPEWITITSYNEWYEGSQIEPSQSYGNLYLDLTKQNIEAWKGVPVQPVMQQPTGDPCAGGILYPETGQVLCRAMESYWQANGGLQQFGFPISESIRERSGLDGNEYTVQYFERAVFELHPENPPPYDVLLSQLGTLHYRTVYPDGAPGQRQNMEAGKLFPETGKWVGGAFLQRWEQNGGLFVNGFPISDEFEEVLSDGNEYTVQYFERARFEFHPDNPPPFNVLLGALGKLAWDSR